MSKNPDKAEIKNFFIIQEKANLKFNISQLLFF